MKYCFGLDVGGTKCAVVLGKSDSKCPLNELIIDKEVFETNCRSYKPVMERFFEIIDRMIDKHQIDVRKEVTGFGVVCGGPLDSEKGVILNPPNLYGWDYVPITQMITERYGIKAKLDNDANACAVAEWKFGAARNYRNIVFLTFGTGLGAGLILNGAVYRGTNDMAGEVGHIRLSDYGPVGYGRAGSFEGFCSGGGLAQLAQMMILEQLQQGVRPDWCADLDKIHAVTAKTVAEAAARGEELAIKIFETCGEYLGRGLSIIVDILNPEIIVIGSVYERNEKILYKPMMESLRKHALARSVEVCKVVPAALGSQIGDYAALSVALDV